MKLSVLKNTKKSPADIQTEKLRKEKARKKEIMFPKLLYVTYFVNAFSFYVIYYKRGS